MINQIINLIFSLSIIFFLVFYYKNVKLVFLIIPLILIFLVVNSESYEKFIKSYNFSQNNENLEFQLKYKIFFPKISKLLTFSKSFFVLTNALYIMSVLSIKTPNVFKKNEFIFINIYYIFLLMILLEVTIKIYLKVFEVNLKTFNYSHFYKNCLFIYFYISIFIFIFLKIILQILLLFH